MPRSTLLFVDDEANVLQVLTKMFEKRFDVVCASSGAEALEILKSRPIDLLLTDQKMPEMTGIQLARTAREQGIDVTTILLTAYTDPAELIAAINEGQVYRYVTKPWDVNDLSMTVKNAIESVELKREKSKLLQSLHKRIEALNVLYELSRSTGVADGHSLDAIVDRLLSVVGRVLPHDVSGVVIEAGEGRSSSLRIRCCSVVSEKALLHVKEAVLSAHRKAAGVLLPEEKMLTRVMGTTTPDEAGPAAFPSMLSVPLVATGRVVGTLSIFSASVKYATEDGELLDLLVNQTTDAIDHLRAAELAARRRIERMVEAMADGVMLLDEKNELVVINPAARTLLQLGDDPAHLTSRHLAEKLGFAPWDMVRGWEYGGQKAFRDELKLYERTVHLTVNPVAEESGALSGVVVVLRDITEQKGLEERKDEFVQMVSHELRTPLTSITGALDLVLNHITGEVNLKQRRFLDMARESTEKLNALVDDLLDLSKFANKKMRMNFEFTHLDEVVKRAVEKYSPAINEKRLKVNLAVPDAAIKALVDPGRIAQLLANLITNAVKFTPEGGELAIELTQAAEAPGFATLTVSNSGDPIAEGDLERIFDRFEQARSRKTRAIRGTGLGLSICRNVVEGHGGRIWAEPVATGARFVTVLPIEPGAEQLNPADHPSEPALPPGGKSRGTVLVVEDNPTLGFILKATLIARQFKVVIARSGEEALTVARKLKPDVITLDIRLPDIDGLKLADIFRHDPETKHGRVVVISGYHEREAAMRAGASGFLLKPINPETLISSVESLMAITTRRKGKVLVIDDDAQIRAICVEVMHNLGFRAEQAATLAEARQVILDSRPDLLLLDVMLPDGDGFSFFEELKAERASSPLSVIFISARTETTAKVRALKLGGDDYLTKPFDALELGARVESVLRRRTEEGSPSPTTMLPGSGAIEREVQRRIAAREAFAFCYLDLDNLKAYNDYYGFAKADGVVRQTADLMREIMTQHGRPGDFLGHVAGDDFVFITTPETCDPICQQAIEAFDRIIPLYYDRADRDRGYIETDDRFGDKRRFAIMSISVVAVMSDGRADHSDLARHAAVLKKQAKAVVGSVFLRSDREPPPTKPTVKSA